MKVTWKVLDERLLELVDLEEEIEEIVPKMHLTERRIKIWLLELEF